MNAEQQREILLDQITEVLAQRIRDMIEADPRRLTETEFSNLVGTAFAFTAGTITKTLREFLDTVPEPGIAPEGWQEPLMRRDVRIDELRVRFHDLGGSDGSSKIAETRAMERAPHLDKFPLMPWPYIEVRRIGFSIQEMDELIALSEHTGAPIYFRGSFYD